ncbi:hypothetical protein HMPREF3227_01059 [Corynebacterium sp. CMW7794]|nr:hypothetical protein HMPREF0307_00118 [Corynebacterium sp. DNF00584]KXI18237.1 hypothetical protein HMPREF3227_01059 [Corynebacterium sp. CMW7794]
MCKLLFEKHAQRHAVPRSSAQNTPMFDQTLTLNDNHTIPSSN